MSSNIVNVTLENFQQVILEGSKSKLVVIDFWADWCEPCKQLMPVLEKIAADYPNDLVLAKIDCEAQQQLAAQFGIRSLPTVAIFKDGQALDGFAGVEPESAIRARLEPHLPKPEDELLQQAQGLLEAGDSKNAYTKAKQAFDLNESSLPARMLLAEAAVTTGLIEQAKALLADIRLADQDQAYQHVKSMIELAEQAADSPELRELTAAVEAAPTDLAMRLSLAIKLFEANRSEEALEHAFIVLQADINFADARQHTLNMINSLPAGDPLAAQFRRRLYSMLY